MVCIGATALLAASCGTEPPRLSPALPTPHTARASSPIEGAVPVRLDDRSFGRSGYACSDCHTTGEAPSRGAPRFPPGDGPYWRGATERLPVAVNLCIERTLSMASVEGPRLGALVLAVRSASGPTAPWRGKFPGETATAHPRSGPLAVGQATYLARCVHCHEGGPAPPVLGRTWRQSTLEEAIRGNAIGGSTDRLMPVFSKAVLPTEALAALVRFVLSTERPAEPSAESPAFR